MKEMTQHLKEAIEINTERMPLYARLTNNKSIPFSKKLIRLERVTLLPAWYFDRKGDQLQQKGVPFIKEEFIDMALTPSFSETFPEGIPFQQKLQPTKVSPYKKEIHRLIGIKDYQGLVDISKEWLEELSSQPHVYCMLRHLIESMRRVAFLAPLHIKKCNSLQIPPPIWHIQLLLKIHLWSLKESAKADEQVAFIQNQGVPFIYQDVPPIDLQCAFYEQDINACY